MTRLLPSRLFLVLALLASLFAVPAQAQVFSADPVPTAPSGSVGTAQPTFTWTSAEPAEGFSPDIRHDIFLYNTFSGAVIQKIDLEGSSYELSPESVDLGVPYRWWLRAHDLVSGEYTAWAGPLTFSVAPGVAPTPIAPSGSLDFNAGEPAFSWTYGGPIVSPTFDLFISNPATNTVTQPAGVASGHQVSLAIGCYQWWVRARDPLTSSMSDWSVQTDFCLSRAAAPVQIAPDQGIGDTTGGPYTPNFSWTFAAATVNTVYDLTIDCFDTSTTITKTGLSGTSYTLTGGENLPADPSCSWTVQARDSVTGGVSESASRSFNTFDVPAPSAVLSITTTSTEAIASPLFQFGHPNYFHEADTIYDVSIFNPALNQTVSRPDEAGTFVDATTREYQLDIDLPGGYDYNYYLRARDLGYGTAGAWSDVLTFRIQLFGDLVPSAVSPTGPVTNPTFSWTYAGGDAQTRFDLYLVDLTNNQLVTYETTADAGTSVTPATLGVTLSSGNTYMLWVRARDLVGGGTGPWSASAEFTIE